MGGGALLLAGLALYLLLSTGGSDREPAVSRERTNEREALDDIDAESREAMRDLLRDAGE